jgi:hypothetical protein
MEEKGKDVTTVVQHPSAPSGVGGLGSPTMAAANADPKAVAEQVRSALGLVEKQLKESGINPQQRDILNAKKNELLGLLDTLPK